MMYTDTMNWFIYACLGAVCIAIHQLSITKLIRLGLPVSFVNAAVYALVAVALSALFWLNKKPVDFKFMHVSWLLLATLTVVVVIVVTLLAFETAPNIGYVSAILSFCTVLVTLFSVFFLGSSLTAMKAAGIILAVMGFIIISLPSNT